MEEKVAKGKGVQKGGVGEMCSLSSDLREGNSTNSCETYTSVVSASSPPSSCSVLQSTASPHNRERF